VRTTQHDGVAACSPLERHGSVFKNRRRSSHANEIVHRNVRMPRPTHPKQEKLRLPNSTQVAPQR
jgi:hypothetical protein